jgi:myosin I
LNFLSQNQHFENRQGQFIIKHYAGDVSYAVQGMTDKNKDQLLKDLLNLVGESSNSFVHDIFPNQVNQDDKRRPPTAGDKIKSSANELVDTLMKAQPSYIRTIKPNENKSSSEYNEANVLHQIKYLGLQENVRIRRAGFAYRQTFDKFVERFALLSPKLSYAGEYTYTGDVRSASKIIFKDTSIPEEEYQMGVTKAFIKTPETLFGLEHMRDRYWHNMAVRIQRAWRNYLRYRIECAIRIQRLWRRVKGGIKEIEFRDQGHQILQQRKERRRYSLLGSRRFFGDYLGLNMPGGTGRMIRDSINLGSQERCVFSSRCELLVTKFGRSSKLQPRMLVLTAKAVYIVVQTIVNNALSITSERTIPLGSIKYISCSTLQDDWFSLGIGSPQEADPLLTCPFKTEFYLQLKTVSHGGFNLKIADTIEYAKKPGKLANVKVVKDPAAQREDSYKSGVVHTGQGESPRSVSRPTPRGKAIVRPIKSGKLLRKGGPSGQQATRVARPPRPTPATHSTPAVVPTPAALKRPDNQLNGSTNHIRAVSATSATRVPPPPPPPPPSAVPSKPQATVKYDFQSPDANLLSIVTGDTLEVLKKESNGKPSHPIHRKKL